MVARLNQLQIPGDRSHLEQVSGITGGDQDQAQMYVQAAKQAQFEQNVLHSYIRGR